MLGFKVVSWGAWLALSGLALLACRHVDETPMLAGPPKLSPGVGAEELTESTSYAQTLEQDIALLYLACERTYSYHQASSKEYERRGKRKTRWLSAIAQLAASFGESATKEGAYPAEGEPYSGVRSRRRAPCCQPRPEYPYEQKARAQSAESRARAESLNASIMRLHDFVQEHGDPNDWEATERAEYRVLFEDAEQGCLQR